MAHHIVIIMLHPQAGKEGDVRAALEKYTAAIQAGEQSIVEYHVADITENAADGGKEFVTVTSYVDQAAAEAHIAGPHFTEVKKVEGLLRSPAVVKHMQPIGGFKR